MLHTFTLIFEAYSYGKGNELKTEWNKVAEVGVSGL